MTDKTPIAPSLEDLSRATVENSRFFGYTNTSGKVLSVLALGTLGGGAVGVTQGLGFLGPVLGLTLPLGIGFAALGASVVAGLAGYWLGNFDDRHISEHNQRAAWSMRHARSNMRANIEKDFVEALKNIQYDPATQSLPYDALGHAVMLADKTIDTLPDHIRLDIYRTQLDLDVYTHNGLTGRKTAEGQELERSIMALPTAGERANAYKAARNRVHTAIVAGTLQATPAAAALAAQPRREDQGDDDTGLIVSAEVAEAIGDALSATLRAGARSRSSGSGSFGGGGGSFGGGGASGVWAAPLASSSNDGQLRDMAGAFADATRSGGGLGGGFDMPDIKVDEDSAKALLILAAAAAVIAAAAVTGVSLWKNWVSRAPEPALGNLHLPMLSKALSSAESKIRTMYKT